MAPKKKRNSYTRGFQSDNAKKYIEGKEINIYKSVTYFIKAEKKSNDIHVSTFKQRGTMGNKGKYNDNSNAKKLRASAFPKTEENFIEYVSARERLFVKDKLGLNWAFMQAK